jgi:tRNA G18 (ribose-2'-O)-methylase SpoU
MRKIPNAEKVQRWRALRPPQRFPIAAVLDNLRSAYNVGAIFRTAECAYLSEVVLCGITARPPHKEVEKTALGATGLIPWRYFADTLAAVRALRGEGWKIAALEITAASIPIQAVGAEHFPLALVVGNEVTGVDERVLAEVDLAVEIPQYGEKESLNVAVAFGVAAFLLVERWRARRGPSTPAGPG